MSASGTKQNEQVSIRNSCTSKFAKQGFLDSVKLGNKRDIANGARGALYMD